MEKREIIMEKPRIGIIEIPSSPKDPKWSVSEATVYSSKISHDTKNRSAYEIWREDSSKYDQGELEDRMKTFLGKLAGLGHASCFYQSNVGISYEVPRHASIFMCSFDFPKYLQQSHRYTKGDSFMSSLGDEAEEIFTKQKDLYMKMIDYGVRKEDARYILPLGISAKHIHQNINFTGLANIFRVIKSENSLVPDISRDITSEALEKLNRHEPVLFSKELIDKYNSSGKGYPVANIFNRDNPWVDKVFNDFYEDVEIVVPFEKDVDNELIEKTNDMNDEAMTFLNIGNSLEKVKGYVASMSLSAWHQLIRNDTVKMSVESVYNAAERARFTVPPDISGSKFSSEYVDLVKESLDFYIKMVKKHGKAKAIEAVPHAVEVATAFSLDGFNLTKGFIRDRTEDTAQWEIRDIARKIKKISGE